MDFDEAAISHLQWKDTLLNHLAQRDERLDPFELSLDDRCALGQWIQGEGAKYSSDPAYISLKTQHTRFHKAVGEVVRGASLGLKIRVEKVLGTDSEFGEASIAVITALVNLKREVTIHSGSMAAVAGGGEDNATAVIVSPASSMDTRYPGWDPSYSVGVARLDEQHQYLFCLLNILLESAGKGRERSAVGMVLAELADYTENHFKVEEALMEQANYPALAEHRREHQMFVARVADFKKNYDAGALKNGLAVMNFLKKWLIRHIHGADKNYSAHLNAIGVH